MLSLCGDRPAQHAAPEPALAGPARVRSSRPSSGARSTAVAVFPAEINLTTARDRQSIVVQATYADGITRDVTERSVDHPGRSQLWSRRAGATFYPVADGATTLAVAFGGKTVTCR